MIIHKELIDKDSLLRSIKKQFGALCETESKINIFDLYIEIKNEDKNLCHYDCMHLKLGGCTLNYNKRLMITSHGYCRHDECKKFFGMGDDDE